MVKGYPKVVLIFFRWGLWLLISVRTGSALPNPVLKNKFPFLSFNAVVRVAAVICARPTRKEISFAFHLCRRASAPELHHTDVS
jgi:hypothetical protein